MHTYPLIEEYLDDLGARLPGPRSALSSILDESRDVLYTATETYTAAGTKPADAARQAVHEFGPVPLIAQAYLPEITTWQRRRTTLRTLILPPILGLTWEVAEVIRPAAWSRPPWLMVPAELVIGSLVVSLCCLSLAAFDWVRLGRLLGSRPAIARPRPLSRLATLVSAIGVGTSVVSLLTIAVLVPRADVLPLIFASAVTVTVLALVHASAHRCLALTRYLTHEPT